MEEKLKRECKPWLEKLFKQHDELGSGSVTQQGMRKIMKIIIPEFNQEEELNEIMSEMSCRTKYTVLNKQTNKFDVQYLENSIDFPAALYIAVYFLMKLERRNTDCFSGSSTVKFSDLSAGRKNFNPVEKLPKGETSRYPDSRKSNLQTHQVSSLAFETKSSN